MVTQIKVLMLSTFCYFNMKSDYMRVGIIGKKNHTHRGDFDKILLCFERLYTVAFSDWSKRLIDSTEFSRHSLIERPLSFLNYLEFYYLS